MATTFLTGSLAAQAQSGLSQAREQRMLHQITSGQEAHDDARIEKGAKEFESMLVGSWLQQAEQSMATVPGAEDDDDSAGRDQMMSLGVQSLANALEASGGIGIASMIAKALHRGANRVSQAAAPAEPNAAPQAGK